MGWLQDLFGTSDGRVHRPQDVERVGSDEIYDVEYDPDFDTLEAEPKRWGGGGGGGVSGIDSVNLSSHLSNFGGGMCGYQPEFRRQPLWSPHINPKQFDLHAIYKLFGGQ